MEIKRRFLDLILSIKTEREFLIMTFRAKAYVIEFFFTTCTTICPIMNNNLVHLQNNLKNYKDFGIASFSINPEYDTVEILKEYETGVRNNKSVMAFTHW